METWRVYVLVKKMILDINQILELWRGLSPRLVKASTQPESPDDEYGGERMGNTCGEREALGVARNDDEDTVWRSSV